MHTAVINIDNLRKIKTSINAGIIDVNDILKFLEVIELQLPDSTRKQTKIVYYMGKPIKDDNYYRLMAKEATKRTTKKNKKPVTD